MREASSSGVLGFGVWGAALASGFRVSGFVGDLGRCRGFQSISAFASGRVAEEREASG